MDLLKKSTCQVQSSYSTAPKHTVRGERAPHAICPSVTFYYYTVAISPVLQCDRNSYDIVFLRPSVPYVSIFFIFFSFLRVSLLIVLWKTLFIQPLYPENTYRDTGLVCQITCIFANQKEWCSQKNGFKCP